MPVKPCDSALVLQEAGDGPSSPQARAPGDEGALRTPRAPSWRPLRGLRGERESPLGQTLLAPSWRPLHELRVERGGPDDQILRIRCAQWSLAMTR